MKKENQKIKRAVVSKRNAAKVKEVILQTITRKIVR